MVDKKFTLDLSSDELPEELVSLMLEIFEGDDPQPLAENIRSLQIAAEDVVKAGSESEPADLATSLLVLAGAWSLLRVIRAGQCRHGLTFDECVECSSALR